MPPQGPHLAERDGRTFTMKREPGGRYAKPTLWLTVKIDEGVEAIPGAYRDTGREIVSPRPFVVVRRPEAMDRAGRALGLDRLVGTHDSAFDAAVVVDSDAADATLAMLFADARVRRSVGELLQGRVQRVVLDPDGLSAVMDDATRDALPHGAYGRIAELLAEAASGLPLFEKGRVTRSRDLIWEALPAALLTILGPFATRFIVEPVDPSAPQEGLVAGLVVWLVVAAMITRSLRGSSRALRRTLVYALPALLFVPAVVYWTLCVVNRKLDTSAPTEHRTHVTSRAMAVEGRGGMFRVAVAPWQPGMRATVDLPTKLRTKADPDAPLIVLTQSGFLGWEWVSGYRLGE